MTKPIDEKHVDVRTVGRYLSKGAITKTELDTYLKSLPNEEENFDLTVFEDDDLGLGSYSDEDVANMAPMSEEDINRFDFLDGEED